MAAGEGTGTGCLGWGFVVWAFFCLGGRASPASGASLARVPFAERRGGVAGGVEVVFGHPLRAALCLLASPSRGEGEGLYSYSALS